MNLQPRITEHPEEPYLGVRRSVTVQTIATVADQIPQIIGWLAARGRQPAGPPFLRYVLIDADGTLEVEAGVPVTTPVSTDGDEVVAGALPGGRYVSVTHVGHPDELAAVTRALLAWATSNGLEWDTAETGRGERWGCRLEVFRTDPRERPDPAMWETELRFRLAG